MISVIKAYNIVPCSLKLNIATVNYLNRVGRALAHYPKEVNEWADTHTSKCISDMVIMLHPLVPLLK